MGRTRWKLKKSKDENKVIKLSVEWLKNAIASKIELLKPQEEKWGREKMSLKKEQRGKNISSEFAKGLEVWYRSADRRSNTRLGIHSWSAEGISSGSSWTSL